MNNIVSERARKGMSQTVLAESLGISPRTLSNWEKDSSDVPSSKACEMAELFGCTIDYLFGRTPERTAQKVVIYSQNH